MWISIAPPETSPSRAVGDALSVLREAAATRWAAQSDDELLAVVEQVRHLVAAALAVESGALAEVDVRGSADAASARVPQGAAVRSGSAPTWSTSAVRSR